MSIGERAGSTVEILSIGDELLRGIVQETNAHWLALRIAARGAALTRVTLLPDAPEIVAAEIRTALDRRPTMLITHGGLGPTDDDRTREALALALGTPLEPHAEAEAIVRRRFADLASEGAVADDDMTEARSRMASLPRDAIALDNEVGTAPGVVCRTDGTTIVLLPGVPPELYWIWEHPLAPMLDEILGPGGFAETTLTLQLRDESRIAWLLKLVADEHPNVYVKSRAHGFAGDDLVRVTAHATGASDGEARARVDAAIGDLRAALTAEGIAIERSG